MNYKSFSLVTLATISSNSFADNTSLNLDILAGLGYTQYNEQSTDDVPLSKVVLKGVNLNASALFPITKTSIGYPVIGGGLNLTFVSGKENVGSSSFADVKMSSLSAVANGGFKFIPTPVFSIFTLANFGYAFRNNYTADLKSTYFKYYTDTSIRNHYFYGVTLIGTYEVSNNFSIGPGITYNRHTMTIESTTLAGRETADFGIDTSFDEYSANIMFVYSL